MTVPNKFPHWLRRETGLIEFVCEHGVGHPAASSAAHLDRVHNHPKGTWSIHGCCGCCAEGMPDVGFKITIYRDDTAEEMVLKHRKPGEGGTRPTTRPNEEKWR